MKYRQTHLLVEAHVKRELNDERHELRRDEMRELRRESCQESRAVGLLVRLEAAGSIELPKIGVRPVSIVIWWPIIILTSRHNCTRAKEYGPYAASTVAD